MCALKICRICLISNVRGYELINNLKAYYEQVLSCKIDTKDSLPKWACYECAALLQKYHKFREKCMNGKQILEDILQKGQITHNSISTVKRNKNLQSNIKLATPSIYIKTYIIKYRTRLKEHRKQTKKSIKLPKSNFPIEFIEEYIPPDLTNKVKEELDQIESDDFLNDSDITMTNDIPIPDIKNGNSEKSNLKNDIKQIDISSDSEDDIPLSNKNIIINDKLKNYHDNIINIDDKPNNLPTEKSDKFKQKVLNTTTTDNKHKKLTTKIKNNDKQKNINKIKKYAKKKKEFLTPKYWDQIKLPEDEAMAEFRKKQSDSKYINAEYKCDKCFKTFSNFDIMERHMKLRHDEKKGTFECRFCHMRFRVKCKLAYHMTEHYTVYNCLRCERKFTVFSSAMYHEQFHNGVIKKCEHCGKEFTHNSSYYTHIRMKHRSTHVCALCGASFVSEAGLAQHKRITHVVNNTEVSESRENYCEKCEVTFLTRAAYDEHLVNSKLHVDNNDDTYNFKEKQKKTPKKRDNVICSYCGAWFLTSSACYKHHMARHPHAPPPSLGPRHVCELCGVSIALASLKSHMNLHMGSKHCCVTCGMQFTTKGAHDRHQVTHTGEKPYACPLCDKRFTQRGGVLLHHRTFHLKQPYPQRNRKKKTEDVSFS